MRICFLRRIAGEGARAGLKALFNGLLIFNPIPTITLPMKLQNDSFVLRRTSGLMQPNEYDLVVIGSGPRGQKGDLRSEDALASRLSTGGNPRGACSHWTIRRSAVREAVFT